METMNILTRIRDAIYKQDWNKVAFLYKHSQATNIGKKYIEQHTSIHYTKYCLTRVYDLPNYLYPQFHPQSSYYLSHDTWFMSPQSGDGYGYGPQSDEYTPVGFTDEFLDVNTIQEGITVDIDHPLSEYDLDDNDRIPPGDGLGFFRKSHTLDNHFFQEVEGPMYVLTMNDGHGYMGYGPRHVSLHSPDAWWGDGTGYDDTLEGSEYFGGKPEDYQHR